ncbi:hypothetical protein MY8738_000558 [Beauveria namnaoensis]
MQPIAGGDRGPHNQVPWNIVQPYLESTILLIGKVLRQPALREILQQVKDAAKCTQSIQNDVTIIKNSVGLSTAPHDATTHKNQTTVTAYKDRTVTVKLKDNGMIQRHRTRPASWTKQHIETAVRTNSVTTPIKVVAAHQLKSGDIQIVANTTAEAKMLKENQGWIRSLGENAEPIVPTYGVIVHGIPTNSLNIKDQETTIQQMLADNHTVIPSANICYIGWLTKEAHLKRASLIVVEFIEPEMANAIIYTGMQQAPCPSPGTGPSSSPSHHQALGKRLDADSGGSGLTTGSAVQQAQTATTSQAAPETITAPTAPNPTVEDSWATSEPRVEFTVQPTIDPQLTTTEPAAATPMAYPEEGVLGFSTQKADDWLQRIGLNNNWLDEAQEDDSSPLTSAVTTLARPKVESSRPDALGKLDQDREFVILGDFNLHHPLWSTRHQRGVARSQAEELLTVVETFQLQLLTVPGTITHRWKNGDSTIDLTSRRRIWHRAQSIARLPSNWTDSDHLPVDVAIDWDFQPATSIKKRLWAMMNVRLLQEKVKERLPDERKVGQLNNHAEIDAYVGTIVKALGDGINA